MNSNEALSAVHQNRYSKFMKLVFFLSIRPYTNQYNVLPSENHLAIEVTSK